MALESPTWTIATASRSGRSVRKRPIMMPPAEPPSTASLALRGPALGDQVLGAVDAVAPGVGLGQLHAGQVPVLAELAAAAHVGHREDAAEVEPGQHAGDEAGVEVDAVGAVGVQIERRGPVALDALARRGSRAAPSPRRGRSTMHLAALVGARRRWRACGAMSVTVTDPSGAA